MKMDGIPTTKAIEKIKVMSAILEVSVIDEKKEN